MTPTKSLTLFFLSLLVVTGMVTKAITVNEKELSSIINPDEVLSYEDPSRNNIILTIEKDNIQIGYIDLSGIEDATTYFNYLSDNKDKLCIKTSEEEVILSGASIQFKGAYISAPTVEIKAETNIGMSDAIIQSQKIIVVCDTLEAHACYVDANIIQIECNDPDSPIKIIRFTLNKDVTIPHALETLRQLNFKGQETTGDLLVVGAKKVSIVFNPNIFN